MNQTKPDAGKYSFHQKANDPTIWSIYENERFFCHSYTKADAQQIVSALNDVEAMRKLMAEVPPGLKHRHNCEVFDDLGISVCNCGLSDLRAKLEALLTHPTQ
jgi:hypothetical protein